MHTELLKHKMKEDGEDNIYDTAGMAICLGVVQNYTFEQDTARKVWTLIRKEKTDEDALFGGFAGAGGDEEASARMVEGLLLTKKACMDFAEELQLEISEVRIAQALILVLLPYQRTCDSMYGRVEEASGEQIAQDFPPLFLLSPGNVRGWSFCERACKNRPGFYDDGDAQDSGYERGDIRNARNGGILPRENARRCAAEGDSIGI